MTTSVSIFLRTKFIFSWGLLADVGRVRSIQSESLPQLPAWGGRDIHGDVILGDDELHRVDLEDLHAGDSDAREELEETRRVSVSSGLSGIGSGAGASRGGREAARPRHSRQSASADARLSGCLNTESSVRKRIACAFSIQPRGLLRCRLRRAGDRDWRDPDYPCGYPLSREYYHS